MSKPYYSIYRCSGPGTGWWRYIIYKTTYRETATSVGTYTEFFDYTLTLWGARRCIEKDQASRREVFVEVVLASHGGSCEI